MAWVVNEDNHAGLVRDGLRPEMRADESVTQDSQLPFVRVTAPATELRGAHSPRIKPKSSRICLRNDECRRRDPSNRRRKSCETRTWMQATRHSRIQECCILSYREAR